MTGWVVVQKRKMWWVAEFATGKGPLLKRIKITVVAVPSPNWYLVLCPEKERGALLLAGIEECGIGTSHVRAILGVIQKVDGRIDTEAQWPFLVVVE